MNNMTTTTSSATASASASATAIPAATAIGVREGRRRVPAWLPEMALEAGLPYATYLVLRGWGVSTVLALVAGGVFPAVFIVVHFVRRHRIDGLGVIVLSTMGMGAALALISGSSRLYLVKESFITGAFGLGMLGSLLSRRPFMFYTGRKFATDGSPTGLAAWDSYWPRSPMFRRTIRVMTAVWGVVFVLEAAVRVVAAYTLSTPIVAGLSGILPLFLLGLLMTWTFAYARRTTPVSRAKVMAASS